MRRTTMILTQGLSSTNLIPKKYMIKGRMISTIAPTNKPIIKPVLSMVGVGEDDMIWQEGDVEQDGQPVKPV